MKTVAEVILKYKEQGMLLHLGGHTTESGKKHVHFQGTPEGFRAMAEILIAQADLADNSAGCQARFNEHYRLPFLTPQSADLVELHCHNNYFRDWPTDTHSQGEVACSNPENAER